MCDDIKLWMPYLATPLNVDGFDEVIVVNECVDVKELIKCHLSLSYCCGVI